MGEPILHLGDCRIVMASMPEASVDSIVCDPPYGLGFMGAGWDHSVPGPDFWSAALRVAKPGAHLVAFGGTRTFHRLTCAIEDAGWEVRDCLSWLYGSGMPKNATASLKPAWEPIILARRPVGRTTKATIAKYGTGGLNADACRIATDWSERSEAWKRSGHSAKPDAEKIAAPPGNGIVCHPGGRWPANVVLDEVAAEALDAMSGVTRSTDRPRNNGAYKSVAKGAETARVSHGHADAGGASRFFYVAKASRKERGEGNDWPTVKPLALMRWLCRLVTPAGGVVLDPFHGSGSTLLAARDEGYRAIGIDMDEHAREIAMRRLGVGKNDAA